MVFTKSIHINVAPHLGGPKGMKEVYILMAFNKDAVKSAKEPFSSAAWRYVYSACAINCTNSLY